MKIKYKIKKYNIEYIANNKVHLVHPTKELIIELAKYMTENKTWAAGLSFPELIDFWKENIVYSINGNGGAWYCYGSYDHLNYSFWKEYKFIYEKDIEL